jgi:hypothetical protein
MNNFVRGNNSPQCLWDTNGWSRSEWSKSSFDSSLLQGYKVCLHPFLSNFTPIFMSLNLSENNYIWLSDHIQNLKKL